LSFELRKTTCFLFALLRRAFCAPEKDYLHKSEDFLQKSEENLQNNEGSLKQQRNLLH